MSFKVRIKNIGKLTDAEISIGEFTVFAGPNNTGKSFVSKLLYSLFNALNANHAETHISNLVGPVEEAIRRLLRQNITDDEDERLSLLNEEIGELRIIARKFSIEEMQEIVPSLLDQTQRLLNIRHDFSQLPLKAVSERRRSAFLDAFNKMMEDLCKLAEMLSEENVKEFISAGVKYKIRDNLIQNFQVPRLSDLRGDESKVGVVSVDNFEAAVIARDWVEFQMRDKAWKRQLYRYSRVIYLESPAYWKLKNALENARYPFMSLYTGRRERLSGVPRYFYDLVETLESEYAGDMAFPEVYEKLTGKELINGKIVISERGDLLFQENAHNFSLHTTAMGVANIGILALLIERKVLDEDTLLFIDEPEAHLHPAWQVVMAEALFELARQGINVVIATHSIDILKWLEVHVKKNPEDERLVALNQFPVENSATDGDFKVKIASIKEELTKPFSDLYLRGL